LNIGGDFILESGTVFLTSNLSTDTEIIVEGNFVQTAGNLGLSANNNNAVTLRIRGNFTKTSGAINAGGGTGTKNIIFDGAGTPQTYSANTFPSNALLHFIVQSGARLDLNSNRLVTSQTTGSFTLEAGATLEVGSL